MPDFGPALLPSGSMETAPQTQIRRLGRDALLYGLPTILSGVASFVMLPVYTRYLTPADYGLLALLDLSLEIALLIFSAGATAGLMRFYFKTQDQRERHRIIFTAWATSTALYAAGSVLILAVAPLIWVHALGGAGSLGMVRLAAANFTITSLTLVPLQMLAIEQRALASALLMTIRLLLQIALNVLFVVGLRAGPMGFLWSTFWSGLALGLFMTVLLVQRTGFAWSWPAFHDLRRFSLPIQFSKAGTFFLAFGDRFFLERFHGLSSVGLYGLAYQFGFLLYNMLATPFFQAWTPQRFQLATEDPEARDRMFNRGFLYGDVAIMAGAVGISLFIRPALAVLTTVDFRPAAAFVPIIVLAYVLQAWAIAVDFGIEVTERTRYTSIATWISVATIAVLYLLLIPPFGGMGAAVATLVAMFVRFAATLYFAQRLWPVSYHWGPHLRMLAGGAVVTIGALITPVMGTVQLFSVAALGFLAYAVWVWFGVLHPDDRAALRVLVRSPRSFPALLRAG